MIKATMHNMKKYEQRGLFIGCPVCGVECSATPGDYWDRKDENFECCGEPSGLFLKRTLWVRPSMAPK